MRISFGAFAPPTFRPGTGPMRLLGYDLYLIELELDGGLAAEHGNDHADRVVLDLDLVHHTGEGAERTIENADSVANFNARITLCFYLKWSENDLSDYV